MKVGAMASLAVPAGIVAWGLFYSAGGKTQGLHKVIASTLSGVVAFLLVIQSKLPALSFIPGAFCGAAVTAWAAPADPKGYIMVAVALVAGAVLGYISEMGAGMIAKKA